MPLENFVPIGFMFVLALFARFFAKSWYFPGAVFPLVWSVYSCMPALLPGFPVWDGALWWIFFSALVMVIGSFWGKMTGQTGFNKITSSIAFDKKLEFYRPMAVLLLCSLFGMGYVIYVETSNVDISEIGHYLPLPAKVFLIFLYLGPLLGGIIYSSGCLSSYRKLLCYLPLVPPATLSLLFTGRSQILQPIFYWIAGYFAIKVFYTRGNYKFISVRNVLGGFFFLIVFIFLGVILHLFRSVRTGDMFSASDKFYVFLNAASVTGFLDGWDKFKYLVFGNVYFFSSYFSLAWDLPAEPRWGEVIFSGPLSLFGIKPRTRFDNMIVVEDVESNVYTGFRPPIDDFGLGGSFGWWLIYGFVMGFAYGRVVEGRQSQYCIFLVACYVNLALFGGSFFGYNSIVFTYVLSVFYLYWSQLKQLEPLGYSDPSEMAKETGMMYSKNAFRRRHGD
jgi:oligosaccharide repeat unit polymerase